MKNIIATIIISTVLLSLSMIGIELWRNNLELIRVTAIKVDELEKVKKNDILPLGKSQLTGGDVISIIRYYSADEEVKVEVNVEGVEKEYQLEGYQQEGFYIPYEAIFEKQVFYEGNKLRRIIFTLKNQ